MIVWLRAEGDLTMTDLDAPGLQVRPGADGLAFGPIEMFATSLGLCSASVLASYAGATGMPTSGLSIRMRWSVRQSPNRLEDLRMDVRWPGLPDARRDAARRAAEQCTLHHTLERASHVETTVAR